MPRGIILCIIVFLVIPVNLIAIIVPVVNENIVSALNITVNVSYTIIKSR